MLIRMLLCFVSPLNRAIHWKTFERNGGMKSLDIAKVTFPLALVLYKC
jgi:hypothetical protein